MHVRKHDTGGYGGNLQRRCNNTDPHGMFSPSASQQCVINTRKILQCWLHHAARPNSSGLNAPHALPARRRAGHGAALEPHKLQRDREDPEEARQAQRSAAEGPLPGKCAHPGRSTGAGRQRGGIGTARQGTVPHVVTAGCAALANAEPWHCFSAGDLCSASHTCVHTPCAPFAAHSPSPRPTS